MGEESIVAETNRRLWAFSFDELLRSFFYLPLFFSKNPLMTLALCWLLYWAFRSVNLYLFSGSPGKFLLGLRVQNMSDRGELDWGASMIRPLADDLGIFFGLLPRAWALVRFDRRHLSDILAETQVIQKKPRNHFPKRHWWFFWGLLLIGVPSIGTEAFELVQSLHF